MTAPAALTCPMCKKPVPAGSRACPTCRTDLSLLADYVSDLSASLARAEELCRAGHLGEAVWAYLAVLEVDPDNAEARRQVGQVAAAVRHFDRASIGERWLARARRRARFRAWADSWGQDGRGWGWFVPLAMLVLALTLAFGWTLGRASRSAPPRAPVSTQDEQP